MNNPNNQADRLQQNPVQPPQPSYPQEEQGFALFSNPTDTLTLIPFFNSFLDRYHYLPSTTVADSGYGNKETCRFMDEVGMDAYDK